MSLRFSWRTVASFWDGLVEAGDVGLGRLFRRRKPSRRKPMFRRPHLDFDKLERREVPATFQLTYDSSSPQEASEISHDALCCITIDNPPGSGTASVDWYTV